MGNCCFQSELPQTGNIQDNKESRAQDVKKNVCPVLGLSLAGKSTFRKRIQILANKLENKSVIDNINFSHDKCMYQLTTIRTIIESLNHLTTIATNLGLVTDDVQTKHIINAYKAKEKHDYTLPLKTLTTTVSKPFTIPSKIEQCLKDIRSRPTQDIFDNDTIDSFLKFFQSKEFKLMLNNYHGMISRGCGAILVIHALFEKNHFKNLVSNPENYVLNWVDYLCSKQHTSGIIEVNINHDNENYSIVDIGRNANRLRMHQIFDMAKVLVVVMDLSGIERSNWEDDDNPIDMVESLEFLHEVVQYRHGIFKRNRELEAKAKRKVYENKKNWNSNGNDVSDMSDDKFSKKGSMSDKEDSVQIIVLLNKYQIFENYATNNINCGSINCCHIIDWTPRFDDNNYKDAQEMIVKKYQKSKEMTNLSNKIWLDCGEIIQLVKLKIQMIFEWYQRYNYHCHDQFEQNVLVCDLLDDCDTIEDDMNKIEPPLKQMNQSLVFCQKILEIWIHQEGMQNVLTKDMTNIILIYCKSCPVAQFGQIFGRIKHLCKYHDIIESRA